MVAGWNLFFSLKSTSFTSSTFPIQPDFSQNQSAAIILNTSSPRTLFWDMINWDPIVCKSNQLHVDILRFFFIKLGYIL